PIAERDFIVFRSDVLTVEDPAYRRVVDAAIRAVTDLPYVVEVVSPLDPRHEDQVSSSGHISTAIVGLTGSGRERQRLAPTLTKVAQEAATSEVAVYVTGRSPLIADLVEQEHADLNRAERLGLPAALLVLVLASGTLVAAGLPILLAMTGSIVTFGALGAATWFTSFNVFVPNIATMLGLGVGIDYALLVVTRYREELAQRSVTPTEAVARAVATAGRTVFFSGVVVICSLAALFLVDAPIFRELAVGAITGVGVMVIGALTVVPAALAVLGHRIERLGLPILHRGFRRSDPDRGFWAGWARGIMRHPVLWTAAASLALLALAAPVTQLELGLSTSTSGLKSHSSGQGREVLRQDFNEGMVSPIQLVVVSRDGPLDDADLDAVARLTAALSEDGGVADAVSVTEVLDRFAGNHTGATLATAATYPQVTEELGELVNFGSGRNIAVVRAVPHAHPDSHDAAELVRRIRNDIVPRSIGDENVEVVVGGLSAQIVDISDESSQKLPLVGGLIAALAFVLLAVIFRSIILPLKAITMNLLSIAAAYGMVVVVFQRDPADGILHLTPSGTTQVYLPLLTFAILFGLSMDYQVFLLGRMKEEWDHTGVNEVAVALGLQRTARVISTAAAVMVSVFVAFTFSQLTEIQMLGFSLAAAVFLDATLVRLILVPGAMRLLGRWNWWFPSWLDHIVPHLDLSEGTAGNKPVTSTSETTAGP
ncbi:MAG: MMPL family transporter, partial [Chloroflexota bacterium]|nr:MMPL family transporter [Chloroflexota bacterium]